MIEMQERVKPNFFIIGAPKCGTTSLAAWLSSHPNIFMSPIKEPHHFCSDFGYKEYSNPRKYQALFKKVKPEHKAIGEASATYLYSKDAVKNIIKDIPDAKFIVLLRNPIEMAPSLHSQFVFDGEEDIKNFREAWDAQEDRRNGKRIPSACREPVFLLYKDACSLGSQLQRVYTLVPKGNVLPILLDDLKNYPRGVWLDILSFLGAPDDGRVDFPVKNAAKERRSELFGRLTRVYTSIRRFFNLPQLRLGVLALVDKMNTRERLREPLSATMRKELVDCFDGDVRLLSRILGCDLSYWLDK